MANPSWETKEQESKTSLKKTKSVFEILYILNHKSDSQSNFDMWQVIYN